MSSKYLGQDPELVDGAKRSCLEVQFLLSGQITKATQKTRPCMSQHTQELISRLLSLYQVFENNWLALTTGAVVLRRRRVYEWIKPPWVSSGVQHVEQLLWKRSMKRGGLLSPRSRGKHSEPVWVGRTSSHPSPGAFKCLHCPQSFSKECYQILPGQASPD